MSANFFNVIVNFSNVNNKGNIASCKSISTELNIYREKQTVQFSISALVFLQQGKTTETLQ